MVKQKQEKEVSERYYEGRGGRKSAVARVRLYAKKGGVMVNEKSVHDYFKAEALRVKVLSPLVLTGELEHVGISVHVAGGGPTGQAEAVRHGIAQALVVWKSDWRSKLRAAGYMTRDPREVERKKPGLKKARKAPQWAKR